MARGTFRHWPANLRGESFCPLRCNDAVLGCWEAEDAHLNQCHTPAERKQHLRVSLDFVRTHLYFFNPCEYALGRQASYTLLTALYQKARREEN